MDSNCPYLDINIKMLEAIKFSIEIYSSEIFHWTFSIGGELKSTRILPPSFEMKYSTKLREETGEEVRVCILFFVDFSNNAIANSLDMGSNYITKNMHMQISL